MNEFDSDMSDMPKRNDAYRPRVDQTGSVDISADDRDVLISRVVDGCAGVSDWNLFRAIASKDPEIWSELAVAQRQYESLGEVMRSVEAVADSVELPGGVIRHDRYQRRFDVVSRWGGWAAAAAILLVWVTGMRPLALSSGSPMNTAGLSGQGVTLLNAATPEQAMDQYMAAGYQAGRVVGELPDPVVVETRVMPDGAFEVLYLRQILERKVLDEVYRETSDEFGNAVSVPIQTRIQEISSF